MVSEFVEEYSDVHYFHSYEMVMDSKNKFDYWKDDNRHVHPHAVDYIISEFLDTFSDDSVNVPIVDKSWITR